jgi:hypothetical protein
VTRLGQELDQARITGRGGRVRGDIQAGVEARCPCRAGESDSSGEVWCSAGPQFRDVRALRSKAGRCEGLGQLTEDGGHRVRVSVHAQTATAGAQRDRHGRGRVLEEICDEAQRRRAPHLPTVSSSRPDVPTWLRRAVAIFGLWTA